MLQHSCQFLLAHGTSLRMGRLGYQSDAQASLEVSYNSLDRYAATLQEALTRPYPQYEAIGIRNAEGEYKQLATSLLQIENEFYGTIRPKRVILPGERPLHALRERGVEYVEVRCMDLDPFAPVGIAPQTMRFLDLFLLHCLLADSPPDTPQEITALARNQECVAARGREPGLRLARSGDEALLTEWGGQVLEECTPIAAALDAAHGGARYRDALTAAVDALHAIDRLPSARVLGTMARDFDNSHNRFVLARSERTRDALLSLPFPSEVEARFRDQTQKSIDAQQTIEAMDTLPFEIYRQRYLSTERLGIHGISTHRA